MKRRLALAGALVIVLGFAFQGCVLVSLSPWFGPADVDSSIDLTGTWQFSNEKEGYRLEKAKVALAGVEVDGYRVYPVHCEDKKASPFSAVLGKLEGTSYLLLAPANEGIKGEEPLMQAVYMLTRIKVDGDHMAVDVINEAHIKSHISAYTMGLSAFCADHGSITRTDAGNPCPDLSDVLLAEDSATLRSFLLANREDEGLFEEVNQAERVKEMKCSK